MLTCLFYWRKHWEKRPGLQTVLASYTNCWSHTDACSEINLKHTNTTLSNLTYKHTHIAHIQTVIILECLILSPFKFKILLTVILVLETKANFSILKWNIFWSYSLCKDNFYWSTVDSTWSLSNWHLQLFIKLAPKFIYLNKYSGLPWNWLTSTSSHLVLSAAFRTLSFSVSRFCNQSSEHPRDAVLAWPTKQEAKLAVLHQQDDFVWSH